MKLLLVEDAPRLRGALQAALTRLGHAVDAAADAAEAQALVRQGGHDAIVLDRMLPGGVDALDLLRDWRRRGLRTPVLVLTALHQVPERVAGLQSGADDYLPKPFDFDELHARLLALVRRNQVQLEPAKRIGPLVIDLTRREVRLRERPVELTAREYGLLELLARHPGAIHSRAEIEERLYADEALPQSNAVDVAIYSLRRKLADEHGGQLIHTRRGLGYLLQWIP